MVLGSLNSSCISHCASLNSISGKCMLLVSDCRQKFPDLPAGPAAARARARASMRRTDVTGPRARAPPALETDSDGVGAG